MDLDLARSVADAVLYEGYVLYPYRASSQKNRMRWQWGVLVPPDQAAHAGEASSAWVDLLVEGPAPSVTVTARFLQLATRADGWDEGVEHEITGAQSFTLRAGDDGERVRHAITGELTMTAVPVPGPHGVVRVHVAVDNTTGWSDASASRDDVMRRSLVGVHVIASVEGGRFVSLVDPPEWARPYAADCGNQGLWPVLVGHGDDVVLAAPIILEERPRLAPESATPLYDGTEIDEILTLRTLTLTDEEKAEARATDPRAAAVIDGVDAMSAADIERLHGTFRAHPGARVRLAPKPGADAQDMFLAGRAATVERVLVDVDGGEHLAVTVDDDPGADLQRAEGRFFYFRPDEVTPL